MTLTKELKNKISWESLLLDQYITRHVSSFVGDIRSIEESLRQNELHPLYEEHLQEEHMFESIGFGYATHSTTMLVYAFLEGTLKEIVALVKERTGSRVKLNELKGGPFEATFVYLEKVASIDLSTVNKRALIGYNTVRNVIVHSDGITMQGDRFYTTLNQLSDQNTNITILESGYVSINETFVQQYLEAVKRELEAVLQSIENWSQIRPAT